MKISNDHLGSACPLIDTADLAHVQGGANTFPPGDGSPHPRPPQPPAPPPAGDHAKLSLPPGHVAELRPHQDARK
jgi:hypothetical protein